MYNRSTYTSSRFFARHPVFRVDEFAAERKETKRESQHALLSHHITMGHLLHVRRGLYAVVPEGFTADSYVVDPYLLAAKAMDDAVVGYRSALGLHGYEYSVLNSMTYLTAKRESSKFDFQGTEYIGVTQPKALMKLGREFSCVDSVDRGGMEIRVTSLERTVVDCFDRLDLAGGIEEVWRSLDAVTYLKFKTMLDYVTLLDNAVTAAKVGLFLDVNKARLHLSDKDMDSLKRLRPKTPTYMFRSKRSGKLVHDWNLIVPAKVLERVWEEPF
jgi:predicted transcriptional regulator of viral defense system